MRLRLREVWLGLKEVWEVRLWKIRLGRDVLSICGLWRVLRSLLGLVRILDWWDIRLIGLGNGWDDRSDHPDFEAAQITQIG